MRFEGRLFLRWLEENRERFANPPVLIHKGKRVLAFRFRGISRKITLRIGSSGVIIVADDNRCCGSWPPLYCFDTYPMYIGKNSYICSLEIQDHQVVYPTRKAIWGQGCFDPLLQWCNHNLRPDRLIGFYTLGAEDEIEERSRWIEFIEDGKLHDFRNDECFYDAIRVCRS